MSPRTTRSPRVDYAAAAGLAIVVILSRLPFRGTILYHWDSINYALALDHFDPTAAQPHMPGYPLYILCARLARIIFPSHEAALAALSIAGSSVAVAALYLLGRRMFDRSVALYASLFLASSPLFWFYGAIALPHAFDAGLVVITAWLFYRLAQGRPQTAVPAAVWLAVAGAVRPQTQAFLFPLGAYASRRIGWRRAGAALVALAIVDLAWLLPLVEAAGGPARYFSVSRAQYARFTDVSSVFVAGWPGLYRNAIKLGTYTTYGWSAGIVPVLLALVIGRRRAVTAGRARDSGRFLLMWILPSFLFYLIVHIGQHGLVFVFLPALCLISAAACPMILRQRGWCLVGVLTLAAGNAAIFLAAPTFPLRSDRVKLLTADTLRRHDAGYQDRFVAVRQHFATAHTLLLSAQWRFPQYYLPEYPCLRYEIGSRWEPNEGRPMRSETDAVDPAALHLTPDASGYYTVVLFDDVLAPLNRQQDRTLWLPLEHGGRLSYLRLAPGARLELGADSYRIIESDQMAFHGPSAARPRER